MEPSSVVQTGVKSFGCENSTAHESPIQSWNLMRPSVVSASKSGAVSPSCKAISLSPFRVFAVDASEPDKKAARTGLREDNEPVAKLVPAGVLAVAAAETGGLLGLLLGFVAALLAIDRLLDRVIGPLGGGGSFEAERAFRHLRRRRPAGDLTYLPEDSGWVALAQRRRLGTQPVELGSIVGTVDQHKATTFDRAFRPPD